MPDLLPDDLHVLADLDDARTAMLRSSRSALLLLEDALHALRDGSTHITDEFLERSIKHLTKGISRNDEIMADLRGRA